MRIFWLGWFSREGVGGEFTVIIFLRVAEATERVRVVNAVTGRWQRSIVQGLAAVFTDFARDVREAGDASGSVRRSGRLVSPLARRRRGEKL